MKILVTGAAGFIGSKVMYGLRKEGYDVVGLDNFNNYYDVRLKIERCFAFGNKVERVDIVNKKSLDDFFEKEKVDKVVHLAAQAGVRYSIDNPDAYLDSNLIGFLNVLEACRRHYVKHLIYASSSSVYGLNQKLPYCENEKCDSPASLYAATKKANELMAHSYSKLYDISMTGLRFFTVYGPWGRPDMSPMLFARAIKRGEPIKVFNNGQMMRDYTYIDDIVDGTIKCVNHTPEKDSNGIRNVVYNIGCGHPVKLLDFVNELEIAIGKKANIVLYPMQPGDVLQTYADTRKIEVDLGYNPQIMIKDGVKKFIDWLKNFDK